MIGSVPAGVIIQARRYPLICWTDGAGSHEVLAQKRLIVGASDSADVVVIDPTVSRVHALLEPTEHGLAVRDLDSTNGTVVDGTRVAELVMDVSGEMQLGATRFHVDFESGGVAPIELWPDSRFHHMVGGSPVMRELFALLARVGPTDTSVLIQGETGTGKELVARSLHDASKRSKEPYVVVDCAALPENLLDAELFGHAKGAFTGAINARAGAIESANGGTVFLDEIGELPVAMQPKLLRVVEQRTVRRIGESVHRPVNIRFVTATHRNLLAMVSRGQFREDLYFRLCVIPVTVPPLRERREDIELLARHFLKDGEVSAQFIQELTAQGWRGNVRELRNYIERVHALGEAGARPFARFDEEYGTASRRARPPRETESPPAGGAAKVAIPRSPVPMLPSLRDEDEREGTLTSSTDRRLASPDGAAAPESAPSANQAASPPPPLASQSIAPGVMAAEIFTGSFKAFRERWIEMGEMEYLERMLHRHRRNVAELAAEAGVDRTYIYRLMRKYKL